MTDLSVRDYRGVSLPTAGTYAVDASHTRVGFVARHLMVTKVRGAFTDVEGTVTITDDVLGSSAQATMKSASIDTGSADRDAHLRSEDFLAVEKHPELTFASRSVRHLGGAEFEVTGDLTIKDVTRPVVLAVEVDGLARDPWGGERLALTATTEIEREDWGLTWNVALESGGVLVSRKVKLEIEAQLVRQA